MLYRMKVLAETVDAKSKSFEARGTIEELSPEDAETLSEQLEAGAMTRFYRGGQPHGRVLDAQATEDGLWMKIRIHSKDADIWRLVETGAINTVEVQPLPFGVDVFLKSVAATYPTAV